MEAVEIILGLIACAVSSVFEFIKAYPGIAAIFLAVLTLEADNRHNRERLLKDFERQLAGLSGKLGQQISAKLTEGFDDLERTISRRLP